MPAEEADDGAADAKRRRIQEGDGGEPAVAAPGGGPAAAAADEDDDEPLAPPALADSDAESAAPAAPSSPSSSSSSSSSSDSSDEEDEDAPVGPGAGPAAGAAPPARPAEGEQTPAPPSPASSSSASSTASELADVEDLPEPESPVKELQRVEDEVDHFGLARRVTLKRDEVVKFLKGYPEQVAYDGLIRSLVRVTMAVKKPSATSQSCLLAEVVGIEDADLPYEVHVSTPKGDWESVRISKRLVCNRADFKMCVSIASVSNGDLTAKEFEQWSLLLKRKGIDDVAAYVRAKLEPKFAEIQNVRTFKFTEDVVCAMLKAKGNLEFPAQTEARMRFQVQCYHSQMHYSGIRDNIVRELEDKCKDAEDQLHVQEAKSTEMQQQWFKERPDLYSLKMINNKNYHRQVADDRHALEFALANENKANVALNPFERRACRPVKAWDVKLTPIEGLDAPPPAAEAAPAPAPAPAAAAAAAGGAAAAAGSGEGQGAGEAAIDKLIRGCQSKSWLLDAYIKGIRR